MSRRPQTHATPGTTAKRALLAAVVCAWCSVPIVRRQTHDALASTSHGLCAPCARRLARKTAR